MTVNDLLRLAPFSLAIITLLLAAGGLFYSHAYNRYGHDVAIAFVARVRFGLAAAATLVVPALMLVSFGRGDVPDWLTRARASALVGLGILATLGIALYLLQAVGRPATFLSSVGRKVRPNRLNRYAQGRRWRDHDVFGADVQARAWSETRPPRGSSAERAWPLTIELPDAADERRVRRRLTAQRLLLRMYRTDPSEMLFSGAATGLRNGDMRTWRAALEVIGHRLRSPKLTQAAMELIVENALELEEGAHRHGSEDGKVRTARALGEIGRARLRPGTALTLAYGLSTLAERRIYENRPVNAVVEALESLSYANPRTAVAAAQRLGQHLVPVLEPPAQIYGSDAIRPAHPPMQLVDLLGELARRAAKDADAELNTSITQACALIAHKLPGAQDAETVDALGMVLADAGLEAARRYGARQPGWGHGTLDAARELRRLYDVQSQFGDVHDPDKERGSWVIESIGRVGASALANRDAIHILTPWRGRSDLGVAVAQQLSDVPPGRLTQPLHELYMCQHNEDTPRELRAEFIGICQRMTGDLLGFRIELEVPTPEGPE